MPNESSRFDSAFNRRATDRLEDNKLKNEILDALGEVEDIGYRTVLTLLLKVTDDIGARIDRGFDEKHIASIVLKDLIDVHPGDHAWVGRIRKHEATNGDIFELVKDRQKNGGYCDYARRMLDQEEANSKSKRRVSEEITIRILWSAMVFISLVISYYLGKHS